MSWLMNAGRHQDSRSGQRFRIPCFCVEHLSLNSLVQNYLLVPSSSSVPVLLLWVQQRSCSQTHTGRHHTQALFSARWTPALLYR